MRFFKDYRYVRDDLRLLLRRQVGDFSRTLQKIMARRNDEQDLLEVRDYIFLCEKLQGVLRAAIGRGIAPEASERAVQLIEAFQPLHELGEELEHAIDESVMDKRREIQEAAISELEESVARADLRLTSDEAGRVRTLGQTKRRGSDEAPSAVEETPFWGPPLEHLIRPG